MSDLVKIKVHIMILVPAVNIDFGDDSTVEWSAARLSTVGLLVSLPLLDWPLNPLRSSIPPR